VSLQKTRKKHTSSKPLKRSPFFFLAGASLRSTIGKASFFWSGRPKSTLTDELFDKNDYLEANSSLTASINWLANDANWSRSANFGGSKLTTGPARSKIS
jgi:hypothetical protein